LRRANERKLAPHAHVDVADRRLLEELVQGQLLVRAGARQRLSFDGRRVEVGLREKETGNFISGLLAQESIHRYALGYPFLPCARCGSGK
jgi:hypothetical protein